MKIKIIQIMDYVPCIWGYEEPDYNQYIEFLESRCFPESRDKMKLILKDLGLHFTIRL